MDEFVPFTLVARKYYDFLVEFTGFDFDVGSFNYHGEVRDKQGNLIVAFTIVTGDDLIGLKLRRALLDNVIEGSYNYDVKKKAKDETGWESLVVTGEFMLISGITQAP